MDQILKTFNGLQEKIWDTSTVASLPRYATKDALSPPLKKLNDYVYEVHNPPRRPSVEIVFFHGLQSEDFSFKDTHINAWVTTDKSTFWLNWLSQDFPDARILTISYDALWRRMNDKRMTLMHTYNTSRKLLDSFMGSKAQIGQKGCPVVLVGHSLGGLFMQNLCVEVNSMLSSLNRQDKPNKHLENFLLNMRGLFMYASPFHGLNLQLATQLGFQRGPLFEDLIALKVDGARRNEEFQKLREKYGWKVFGVGEIEEVTLGSFKGIVVSEASARHNVDVFCTIVANHFNVCRPISRQSTNFQLLLSLIADVVNKDKVSPSLFARVEVVGLEASVEYITKKLIRTQRLGIGGIGGIGKTTLAKAIFDKISKSFEYTCFVDEVANIIGITNENALRNEILRRLMVRGHNVSHSFNWCQLEGKKILIILDNVESESQVMLMTKSDNFSKDSRLIVTSRDTQFLLKQNFEIHMANGLGLDDSKCLFCIHAFKQPELPQLFEECVTSLVQKCDGSPLALNILGRYFYEHEKDAQDDGLMGLSDHEASDTKSWIRLLPWTQTANKYPSQSPSRDHAQPRSRSLAQPSSRSSTQLEKSWTRLLPWAQTAGRSQNKSPSRSHAQPHSRSSTQPSSRSSTQPSSRSSTRPSSRSRTHPRPSRSMVRLPSRSKVQPFSRSPPQLFNKSLQDCLASLSRTLEDYLAHLNRGLQDNHLLTGFLELEMLLDGDATTCFYDKKSVLVIQKVWKVRSWKSYNHVFEIQEANKLPEEKKATVKVLMLRDGGCNDLDTTSLYGFKGLEIILWLQGGLDEIIMVIKVAFINWKSTRLDSPNTLVTYRDSELWDKQLSRMEVRELIKPGPFQIGSPSQDSSDFHNLTYELGLSKFSSINQVEEPMILEQKEANDMEKLQAKAQVSQSDNSSAPTMEVDSLVPDSSQGHLRADICFPGSRYGSFQDEFDPSEVLCLCSVKVSFKVVELVELVFFHLEGRASLIGVGVPFSKVLIGPESNIVVKEMEEDTWIELWMHSYDKSFKPLMFIKKPGMNGNGSSTSSNNFNLSIEEALSKFGVGVEGRNHYELANVSQSAKDEGGAKVTNSGASRMMWLDQLMERMKPKEEKDGGEQQVGAGLHETDHSSNRSGGAMPTWQHKKSITSSDPYNDSNSKMDGESRVPTSQGKRHVVGIDESMVKGDIKVLIVHVDMNERHCRLYNKCYDFKTGQPIYQVVYRPNDDVLRRCFIKPKMTIEFLCNPTANGGSKLVNVKLKVDYQISGNIGDDLKFGWYQDDLSLSFDCEDQSATISNFTNDDIISHLEDSDVEVMSNRGKSQSSSNERRRDIFGKGTGGVRAFAQVQVGGMKGDTNVLGEGSNLVNQRMEKCRLRCLRDAPSFAITSRCTGSKMAYKASLYHDLEAHQLWHAGDRRRFENSSGMFSTASIEVHGTWRLLGNDHKIHTFEAEKKLLRHTRKHQHVEESHEETLWQKISRNSILNHNFDHMHDLKKSAPYEWILMDPHDPSPVPTVIT